MQFTLTLDIPAGAPRDEAGAAVAGILRHTAATLSNSLHPGDGHQVRDANHKPCGRWAVTPSGTPDMAQPQTTCPAQTALSTDGKAIIERAAQRMHSSNTPPHSRTAAALSETAGLLTYLAGVHDTEQTPWVVQRLLLDGERIARAYLDLPIEDETLEGS